MVKPRTSISQQLNALRVAIYIRVSTHWQVDKDSLQVQQRELIAYCQLVLGINDYVIFEDPGYSAKNTDRPDYQKMMSRIRTGEFSHLLVWKIDRISRNLLDFASMYAELKNLGVIFVSKNEQFDTSSAIGEAMLKIILVFAELERNMTSERVSAVMLSRANNGQWNGGRIPYGYSYDKETNSFSIDPVQGPITERIFSTYEEHQSSIHIANVLNSEGLFTRSGHKWSSVAVHKILTNPFYYGTYRYNIRKGANGPKRDDSEWVVFEDHHPAIISKERYDAIQYRLKRNKRGGNQRGVSIQRQHFHIFAGLLKCGHCGSILTATPGKRRADGWVPSNYGCYNRRRSNVSCKSKFVSDASVAPFILSYLSNILVARENIGQRTTPDVLERKLLKGAAFDEVDHIEPEGLNQMLAFMQDGQVGIEYHPSQEESSESSVSAEIASLEEQKRKKTIALSRLKSLFLYSEQDIPEKDFIIERKQLVDDLTAIDARLEELREEADDTLFSDESFIEQASYFIMVNQLMQGDCDDTASFVRSVDSKVVKAFIQTIIESIIISDGRVSAIHFKNGLTHTFVYK